MALTPIYRVITIAARATLALALPVAFTLVLFAKPLMGMVFGSEFERGSIALIILCTAQVINAGAGSVNEILNMTGNEMDTALGMTIGAVTNVLLNVMLIPKWGIEGAALATGISLIVWNLILIIRVQKRLGIDSTALGISRVRRTNSDT